MSITIARAYELVDDIEPKSSSADYKRRYGEIYVTRFREIIFQCTLCDDGQQDYKQFLDHILEHYYAHEAERQEHSSPESVQVREEPEDEYGEETSDFSDDIISVKEEETENPLSEEDSASKTSSPPSAQPIRRYQKRSSNAQHCQVQGEERKHKCETCGAAFKDLGNMRAHSRRHTGKKRFQCSKCTKGFYTRTELIRHNVRHSAERPYFCAYCGQNFKSTGTLSNHEKRHTSFPEHNCEFCDKSYYDGAELRRHMVVHTQERNHVCNICNGKFARLKSLKQHIKLHVNAREYECDLCDMAFNQLPALLSHKKNKHKMVSVKVKSIHTSSAKMEVAVRESCQRCQMHFKDKAALLEHHRRTHADADKLATNAAMEEVKMETL